VLEGGASLPSTTLGITSYPCTCVSKGCWLVERSFAPGSTNQHTFVSQVLCLERNVGGGERSSARHQHSYLDKLTVKLGEVLAEAELRSFRQHTRAPRLIRICNTWVREAVGEKERSSASRPASRTQVLLILYKPVVWLGEAELRSFPQPNPGL